MYDFVKTTALAGFTFVWELYFTPQFNSSTITRLIGFTVMGLAWNGVKMITETLEGNYDPDGFLLNSFKMGVYYMTATEIFTPFIGGIFNNDPTIDNSMLSNLVSFFILSWIWVGPLNEGIILLISKFGKNRRERKAAE